MVQAFLGGPVHAELAAVQALLAHKAAHELDGSANVAEDPEQLGRTSTAPEEAESSGQAQTLDADMLESSRDDLTCPICMVRAPAGELCRLLVRAMPALCVDSPARPGGQVGLLLLVETLAAAGS